MDGLLQKVGNKCKMLDNFLTIGTIERGDGLNEQNKSQLFSEQLLYEQIEQI